MLQATLFSRSIKRTLLFALGLGLVLTIPAPVALAAGVVGTGTAASCTQEALRAAMAGGGAVTFNCGPGTTTIAISETIFARGTVSLDGDDDIILKGIKVMPFKVSEKGNLTLSNLILTTEIRTLEPLLEVDGSATLKDVTLTNAISPKGAVVTHALSTLVVDHCLFQKNSATVAGGAIFSVGDLTIKASRFEDNSSAHEGGAIYQFKGKLDIRASVFLRNKSKVTGGAIYIKSGPAKIKNTQFIENQSERGGALSSDTSLSILNSTFEKNTSVASAGAIFNSGVMELVNSTVIRNTADTHGGIYNFGKMSIERSTIAYNTAEFGAGGVANWDDLTIINSTLSDNKSQEPGESGGGLYSVRGSTKLVFVTIAENYSPTAAGIGFANPGSTVTIKNTVLDNNGNDCGEGKLVSEGHNLALSRSCFALDQRSDRKGVDPLLGKLEDNGGSTLTRMPKDGSPLLSAGVTVPGIEFDQRGVKRPASNVDIGAVQRSGQ